MGDYDFLLQIKDITKSYGGVQVLHGVSLDIKPGEVHGLMGENGAGKSTLMKIVCGIELPDSGEIVFKGRPVRFTKPADALNSGISIIHQELNAILDMSVAENLFIGREMCRKFGIVKKSEMTRRAREWFRMIDVDIDPNRKLSTMSVAEQQLVEIVKALSYDSDVIIMDEPTSAITDQEVYKLFEIIRKIKKQGKSIIYISHKMDEIYTICDTLTVLRDGQFVATESAEHLEESRLISLMVGRELKDLHVKGKAAIGEPYLEVKNLTSKGKFHDVSFHVRKGEVLGIAGLMGAGRTELAEAIIGARPIDSGELRVKGRKVSIRKPRDAIQLGIGYVTEDRKLLGLDLKSSVKKNTTIVSLDKFLYAKQVINFRKERNTVDQYIGKLNVKTHSRDTLVSALSGGNQQKVVLARWLLGDPDILILDEPTRGIDVGAKAEIYKMISDLAKEGKAIVMISSEMPELLGMSDRIVVLHEGKLTGEFQRDEFDQEKIMMCATGHFQEGFQAGNMREEIEHDA